MDLSEITKYVGYVIYVVLFLIALWGAYCVVMVWSRVKQKRFRNEEIQVAFLQTVEERLEKGDRRPSIEEDFRDRLLGDFGGSLDRHDLVCDDRFANG